MVPYCVCSVLQCSLGMGQDLNIEIFGIGICIFDKDFSEAGMVYIIRYMILMYIQCQYIACYPLYTTLCDNNTYKNLLTLSSENFAYLDYRSYINVCTVSAGYFNFK